MAEQRAQWRRLRVRQRRDALCDVRRRHLRDGPRRHRPGSFLDALESAAH
jgi:hypothetical protein